MYDAIVIGSRCAGAPTAMLLARAGRRVLVVDRATFPSDVLSGHTIQPAGVARLQRWGLLDKVRATGVPFTPKVRFDFGPVVLEGEPTPSTGSATPCASAARSSTRCSPPRPPTPAPRCARASPCRSCCGRATGWSASAAATPPAPPSRSAPTS